MNSSSFMVILIVLIGTMVMITMAASCYDENRKPYCNKSKCPKVSCKGNVDKDVCGCCDVCMKQEGEVCGGQHSHFGKCDHHVKLCIKLDGETQQHCHSLKTALENGSRKHLKELAICKTPKNKKSKIIGGDLLKFVNCQQQNKGAGIFCKKDKVTQYETADCCLHASNCTNPDDEIYEPVVSKLDLAAMVSTYREQKRFTRKLARRFVRASLQNKKFRLKLKLWKKKQLNY